jgi:hypothetical protein
MKQSSSPSPAGRLTVAALLVAALGFAIQIFSGVEVPAVPPGLVILLVAAGLVAFLPWRWAPAIGAFVGLFLFVGFFASGAVAVLLDPARPGVLVGAWLQFLALVAAIATGIAATTRNYGTRRREAGR